MNISAASLTFSCLSNIIYVLDPALSGGAPSYCLYLISFDAPSQSRARIKMWVNMVPGRWSQDVEWGWVEGGRKWKVVSKGGVNEQVTVWVTGTHNWGPSETQQGHTSLLCYWGVQKLDYLFTISPDWGLLEKLRGVTSLALRSACWLHQSTPSGRKTQELAKMLEQSSKRQLYSYTSHEVSNTTPFYRLGKWGYEVRLSVHGHTISQWRS